MSKFIIFSSSERLHPLVDSIVTCCHERGVAADVAISTGKILSENGGFVYKYIGGESLIDTARPLNELVSNQIAVFRAKYLIEDAQPVNFFFFENSMTEEEAYANSMWLDEIYKADGELDNSSIRLFRVFFAFNPATPTDVRCQPSASVIERVLNEHKQNVETPDAEMRKDKYLLYIRNKNLDLQALNVDNGDFALKMPRLLADFMMLVSAQGDSSCSLPALTTPDCITKCFSIGWAEHAYLFETIQDYYEIADKRSMYDWLLTSAADSDLYSKPFNEQMEVERNPVGLRARMAKYESIYRDYAYDESVDGVDCADGDIDKHICRIEEIINGSREAEIKEFEESELITQLCNEISNLENSILEGESNETLTLEQKEELEQRIKELEKKKEQAFSDFTPQCPPFVSRDEIFQAFLDEDKQIDTSAMIAQYEQLIRYVISHEFRERLKKAAAHNDDDNNGDDTTAHGATDEQEKDKRRGCLRFLFFWKRDIETTPPTETEGVTDPIPPVSVELPIDTSKIIKQITYLLKKKQDFKNFSEEVERIEREKRDLDSCCENFVPRSHSNLKDAIISMDALKQHYDNELTIRLSLWREKWTGLVRSTLSALSPIVSEERRNYINRLRRIDWEHPFGFVDIVRENSLPSIVGKLMHRSSPLVHPNEMTDTLRGSVNYQIYSDLPEFENIYESIKSQVRNGSEICAHYSPFTASKICVIQYLPLTYDMLKAITAADREYITGLETSYGDENKIADNINVDVPLPIDIDDIIDWGEQAIGE